MAFSIRLLGKNAIWVAILVNAAGLLLAAWTLGIAEDWPPLLGDIIEAEQHHT
jgi:energy-converting hydrogenase Eha subunit A